MINFLVICWMVFMALLFTALFVGTVWMIFQDLWKEYHSR